MHPICGAHSATAVTIPVHCVISLPSVQAEVIHGAALASDTIAFTHLGSACFHLQYNFNPCLTHIHIRTCSHNSIYNHNHILRHNFNHLHIYSKLFNIPAVSHQQNLKLQKQFPLCPQKVKKKIFPPCCACGNIIPARRPDRRSRDRRFRRRSRRFGITNKDVRYVWGGALVVKSLAHSSGVWGPGRGSGVLLCPLVAICP